MAVPNIALAYPTTGSSIRSSSAFPGSGQHRRRRQSARLAVRLALRADRPRGVLPREGRLDPRRQAICTSCEVRAQCLEYALENDERFGIWGGLSERERRKLRKRAGVIVSQGIAARRTPDPPRRAAALRLSPMYASPSHRHPRRPQRRATTFSALSTPSRRRRGSRTPDRRRLRLDRRRRPPCCRRRVRRTSSRRRPEAAASARPSPTPSASCRLPPTRTSGSGCSPTTPRRSPTRSPRCSPRSRSRPPSPSPAPSSSTGTTRTSSASSASR